ncbi:hypothetical protein COLO4_03520 [Corchorus olitorius]|uniref:Uncharacterized protein n=1 Tax=Corchorus olitorius TaxID=93759 RepID=A0A1R3KYB3_9ROSI|nr:hypothetical protein COLO4_03520 [Corchorus olitorius]
MVHFDNDVDRRAAVLGNPWCCHGATFVLGNWSPNIPLNEVRLARFSVWLQIWDLPFEYQQPLVAERLPRTAGEVIRIDWRFTRPRNIRFMRVRININHDELDKDDGTSQWVQFSYERIEKIGLGCGLIGHTHPNYRMNGQEAQRRIRTRLERVNLRYGLPIHVDPAHHYFSNRMRAFLTRASRRNTRMVVRQGAGSSQRNGSSMEGTSNRMRADSPPIVVEPEHPAPMDILQTRGTTPTTNESAPVNARRTFERNNTPINLMATRENSPDEQNGQRPINQNEARHEHQQGQGGAASVPQQNQQSNRENNPDTAQSDRTREAINSIQNLIALEGDYEIVERATAFNEDLQKRIVEIQEELNNLIPVNQPMISDPFHAFSPPQPPTGYPQEPIEDAIEEFDTLWRGFRGSKTGIRVAFKIKPTLMIWYLQSQENNPDSKPFVRNL